MNTDKIQIPVDDMIKAIEERAKLTRIVSAIQRILDGVEWSSSTLDEVASVLISNGYVIRDPQQKWDDDYGRI